AQMAGYESDGLGYKSFRPDLVVIPSDADELAQVVRVLHDARVPICLRGAGTSLSGGPVAAQGGAIIHTSRLRAIREISQDGLWCEVESGVNLRLEFDECSEVDVKIVPVVERELAIQWK
ncbi:MAG: FAD-binding protein, partial [Verrucomicrobiota bacterium]